MIKTYVRMGLAVGIVVSMAHECDDSKDLAAIEAVGLFPRNTTWIGYRKDADLRRYMLDFIRLFAPHIDAQQIEGATKAQGQHEIDALFKDTKLPVRGVCSDGCLAAA